MKFWNRSKYEDIPEFSIIGSTGLLGSVLLKTFEDAGHRAFGVHRNSHGDNVDFSSASNCVKRIVSYYGDVIINCVGITKALINSDNMNEASYLNGIFPKLLGEECTKQGKKLIHISTDCVFSGNKGDYVETDVPDPIDHYGRTKLLGESIGANHLIIRTSFIGRGNKNKTGLLNFILSQNGDVYGYTNHLYTGLTAPFLSKEIVNIVMNHKELCGLYHLGGPLISKHDLLVKIIEIWDMNNVNIIPFETESKRDMSLNCDKISKLIGYTKPTWDEMLKDLHGGKS